MRILIGVMVVLLLLWGYLGLGYASWQSWPADATQQAIWWQLRLPRMLLALLNGAALGAAGAVLQMMLRNPLAEPGITGVSAGASLAIVIALYFSWLPPLSWSLPWVGALGAGLSLLTLWLVAGREAKGVRLILAGVAVAAFSGAWLAVVLNLSPNPFAFQELSLWMLGSVANRGWEHVLLMLPGLLVGGLMLWLARHFIAAHLFDDATLRTLGYHYARWFWWVMVALTLLVASSVLSAGVIAFVGLVAPHLASLGWRLHGGRLIVASSLVGALLLLSVDALVKVLPTNVELYLGVVTAVLGAPLLVWLMHKQQR